VRIHRTGSIVVDLNEVVLNQVGGDGADEHDNDDGGENMFGSNEPAWTRCGGAGGRRPRRVLEHTGLDINSTDGHSSSGGWVDEHVDDGDTDFDEHGTEATDSIKGDHHHSVINHEDGDIEDVDSDDDDVSSRGLLHAVEREFRLDQVDVNHDLVRRSVEDLRELFAKDNLRFPLVGLHTQQQPNAAAAAAAAAGNATRCLVCRFVVQGTGIERHEQGGREGEEGEDGVVMLGSSKRRTDPLLALAMESDRLVGAVTEEGVEDDAVLCFTDLLHLITSWQ
jgi:hypothetical protein